MRLGARKWWLATIGLAVGAIVLEIVAKHYASVAVDTLARVAGQGAPVRVRNVVMNNATLADTFTSFGMGLALLAVVCWVISLWARERATPAVPIVLLASYLMAIMLMV